MNNFPQMLLDRKKSGIPLSMVTAYDYPTARLAEEAQIDVVLVGDSVGTNVLGYDTEEQVTMADMLHHLRAVARGAPGSCIMVDIPFGCAPDPATALENGRLLIAAGAHIVKIEGWGDKREVIAHLSAHGISVCGHIGYNPQYHGPKGRIFGKDSAGALELVRSAQVLEQAGAVLFIVEKVPEEVGRLIAESVSVPAIGIGSGRYCDGQVLVFHDIVGLGWRTFRHARAYTDLKTSISAALRQYKAEVEHRVFPGEEQVFHLSPAVLDELSGASIKG